MGSTSASAARVLVVEDDAAIRDVVARYLERDGHRVLRSASGPDGLAQFRSGRPDLVVLDLMLPGVDGLTVCAQIRRESDIPVLMLTARGTESDRIVGLEHGADDYVVKPFSPRELALRVAGLLRRARPRAGDPVDGDPGTPDELVDGDLVLDPTARIAARAGQPVPLTVREFDLLLFLLRHAGQVFTRAQLLERVWGWTFGDSTTVTVHVRRLREKVENDPADPTRIATVWGVGYRYDRTGGAVPG